jgi:hypothetical protein
MQSRTDYTCKRNRESESITTLRDESRVWRYPPTHCYNAQSSLPRNYAICHHCDPVSMRYQEMIFSWRLLSSAKHPTAYELNLKHTSVFILLFVYLSTLSIAKTIHSPLSKETLGRL